MIAVVFVYIVAIRAVSSRPIDTPTYFEEPLPAVIAHQGGNGLRPGNTLLAFRHAWALGADVLEMDVHATRDGHVVLMHDARLDRTTDGSGSIKEQSLGDLRRLDAAFWWPRRAGPFPFRGQGVGVPTLAEVLAAFPDARFNIEIKQVEPPIGALVCNALRSARAMDRALVASVSAGAMADFRAACPRVATSAPQREVLGFMLLHYTGLIALYQPRANALQVPVTARGLDLIDASVVRDAARRGMFVDAWTVNDVKEMERLRAFGVAGIITDYPDQLLALLGRDGHIRSNAAHASGSPAVNRLTNRIAVPEARNAGSST
jgi:glycerophosphoryl diester phosphodiesterase